MNDSVEEDLEVPEEGYTVAIRGENLSFKEKATGQQLLDILSVLLGGEASETTVKGSAAAAMEQAGTSDSGSSTTSGAPRKSIAEFLDEVAASTNYDRIAAFCLYAREYLDRETVSQDALPRFFERAGRPVPKNLPRDVKKAVKRGLVSRSHEDGDALYVTASGEEMLYGEDETE